MKRVRIGTPQVTRTSGAGGSEERVLRAAGLPEPGRDSSCWLHKGNFRPNPRSAPGTAGTVRISFGEGP